MSVDITDQRYTYNLKLSCDAAGCAATDHISGKTKQGCVRWAELDGWTMTANKLAVFCPACSAKMKGLTHAQKEGE